MTRDEALRRAEELSRAGNPHGELITVQYALDDAPDDPSLRTREEDLQTSVLGSLPDGILPTWTHGFVTSLDVEPQWAESEVVTWLEQALPSYPLSQLERLRIGRGEHQERTLAALSRLPPTVRTLEIVARRRGRQEIGRDVTHLDVLDGHPGLVELEIHARHAVVPPLSLPALEHLALACEQLHPTDLGPWSATALPSLRHLALGFGPPHHRDGEDDAANLLLERLPTGLDRLDISGGWFGDGLCVQVARLPGLAGLSRLQIAHAAITDRGAEALVDSASLLTHLEALVLRGNTISPTGRRALENALPRVDVSNQRQEIDRFPRFPDESAPNLPPPHDEP